MGVHCIKSELFTTRETSMENSPGEMDKNRRLSTGGPGFSLPTAWTSVAT